MLNISFVILVQDKNRDVIVSFPDVHPNSISTLQTVLNDVHERYGKRYLRRAILEEPNDSYDKPHLWYSTSEVIHALKLFLESGNQLSDIRTFRLDTLVPLLSFLLYFLSSLREGSGCCSPSSQV